MSLSDRSHRASAALFALLELNEDQWRRSSKQICNSVFQYLANDTYLNNRFLFCCIMNNHSVNCDVIGRRQRNSQNTINCGVSRNRINTQRAILVEKADNTASVQLWLTGDVCLKKNSKISCLFFKYCRINSLPLVTVTRNRLVNRFRDHTKSAYRVIPPKMCILLLSLRRLFGRQLIKLCCRF